MVSVSRLALSQAVRRVASAGSQHPVGRMSLRVLSTVPQPVSRKVVVDRYSAMPPAPTSTQRLPNDMIERNALYEEEESRTMGGVTATVRHDWTKQEIADIYGLPFHELMYRASTVHRMYWDPSEVQQCTLLSIKTGGCTEDCSYCSQSTRHNTFVKPTPTMKVQEVLEAATRAKEAGSTRFCMGAAWRELGNKKNAFNHILEMVRGVNGMVIAVLLRGCIHLYWSCAGHARSFFVPTFYREWKSVALLAC